MSWRAIANLLDGRLSSPVRAWLAEALTAVSVRGDREAFFAAWSAAGRRLGRGALELTAAECQSLREAQAAFVPQGWGGDECGRALLLMAALSQVGDDEHVSFVEGLYRTGELRERQALLRVLAHLPRPERFVSLASDAIRTNELPVLEAIACENPFPGRLLSEPAFNQLVLKCLFCGIPLSRLEGLAARLTPELARMVSAYASERKAAGRTVPADVALVLDGGIDATV